MEQQAITPGICACGCGKKTKLAVCSYAALGYVKGQPYRFVKGHSRSLSGENNHRWKGGKGITGGYAVIYQPDHPRAHKRHVYEHITIAEKALGKPLPTDAEVHHVNENRIDNTPGNLVICENHAYHYLLHLRTKALKACGHAHYRKCQFCKTYDDPSRLVLRANMTYHKQCNKEYVQRRALAKRTTSREK